MKSHANTLALLVLLIVIGFALAHAKDGSNAPVEPKARTVGPQSTSPSPERPVDLNKASKVELKRLPGIGEREANLIISARPFRTKAELVTRNIIPEELYPKLRRLVEARNPPQPKLPPQGK